MTFHTLQEARAAWEADVQMLADYGISFEGAESYLPEPFRRNSNLAMDALPTLSTAANSGIPVVLTTYVDPTPIEILFAPNKAATIFGEQRKGTWTDTSIMFQLVEHDGEVTSYGDNNNNGHIGANTNWPQRQPYLFQTMKQYGELEIARAALAKLNWVAQLDKAAVQIMDKYMNLTYFFGVNGLQNYGLLNDPSLSASLTPSTKAASGVKWINANGQINAQANEVFADIQSLFYQLVEQTGGLVQAEDDMTLALSPGSAVALTATNTFNVNVHDLLKKNFPKLKVETAVQYGVQSASNQQGIIGGNFIQLIATSVEGYETGFCAFNEKFRSFAIIKKASSYEQKVMAGTLGAVIKEPIGISSMLGI